MRRKLLLTGLAVALLLFAALGVSISLARGAKSRLRAVLAPRRRAATNLSLERSTT
jgi:hypothetical protein